MFYRELASVVRRWSREAELTSFQMIGALEMVKQELLDHNKKQWEKKEEEGQ